MWRCGDTIAKCDIVGASDTSIRNAEPNDIGKLPARAKLRAFCHRRQVGAAVPQTHRAENRRARHAAALHQSRERRMVAREADRKRTALFFDSRCIFTSKELFPKCRTQKLILPLVIEQVLAITVGLADTMMVSSVGEAAVSGVSLVDMLNVLIINIFSALATGGAVVVAQLLGARKTTARAMPQAAVLSRHGHCADHLDARHAVPRTAAAPAVRHDRGRCDAERAHLPDGQRILLPCSLRIYNAGAALFRAQGNSRISMLIAGLINIVNLIGNSLFIFVFKWGVGGAALSSVLSRGTAAVAITILLLNPGALRSLLRRGQRFRPDKELIRRILQIGAPNGLENSLFQLGRVLVVSMISLFGTTQITANALCEQSGRRSRHSGSGDEPGDDNRYRAVHRLGR